MDLPSLATEALVFWELGDLIFWALKDLAFWALVDTSVSCQLLFGASLPLDSVAEHFPGPEQAQP